MAVFDLVTQEDEWGCGAACIASLLDISYRKAKTLVEEIKGYSINEKPCGLEIHHLALALHEQGVKVVADWNPREIPDGTIVCIKGEGKYAGYHYMLKTPKGWMDPWYNLNAKTWVAKYRKSYPSKTEFIVALIPMEH